jgi:peptide/nickel transport system substrate-binding protein
MMKTFPHPQPLPARGEGRFRLLPRKRGRLGGGHANLWLVIVMLALSTVSACHKHSYDLEPATIRFHLPQDPILLNPVISEDAYSNVICTRIFESLLERDRKTLKMKGQIAEKWTIGGDKLTYTFNLRRNVLFHDGKPLTSADVLFSYNMMMSEKIPNAHKKVYYKDVLSVSAPDAYTVVFRMKNRYAMALEHLGGFEVIPRHVYSVGDFMKDERNLRGPVGSGPYVFSEWKTGTARGALRALKTIGARNPRSTKIEFTRLSRTTPWHCRRSRRVTSTATTCARCSGRGKQTQKSFCASLRRSNISRQVTVILATTCAQPPFNDRRVRQAMAHLMDLERVKTTILENLAEVTTGPFLPQSLQYNQSLKTARIQSTEGDCTSKEPPVMRKTRNGLIAKDGKPLEIELMIAAGGGFADQFVSVIKEDFANAQVSVSTCANSNFRRCSPKSTSAIFRP